MKSCMEGMYRRAGLKDNKGCDKNIHNGKICECY